MIDNHLSNNEEEVLLSKNGFTVVRKVYLLIQGPLESYFPSEFINTQKNLKPLYTFLSSHEEDFLVKVYNLEYFQESKVTPHQPKEKARLFIKSISNLFHIRKNLNSGQL